MEVVDDDDDDDDDVLTRISTFCDKEAELEDEEDEGKDDFFEEVEDESSRSGFDVLCLVLEPFPPKTEPLSLSPMSLLAIAFIETTS